MTKAQTSALLGLVMASASALVASGVFTDTQVSTWQPVLTAVITFVSTVAIRSAKAPL